MITRYPVMTNNNPFASTNFTGKKEAPYFEYGEYSYGALLGYLSNLSNYNAGYVKITALSGKAEYDKFGKSEFCQEFYDHYDIHRLLLWHGNGKINMSHPFNMFANRHGISFDKTPSLLDERRLAYCTGYVENLLIVWNFIARKYYDLSAVEIYPQYFTSAADALDEMRDTIKERMDPANNIPAGTEDGIPEYSEMTFDGIFADDLLNNADFIQGFEDGFNYI